MSNAVKRPVLIGQPSSTAQPSYCHPSGSSRPGVGGSVARSRNQTPAYSLVSGPSVGVAKMN